MPPVRTNTMPAKPIKTERTHEENQERAYIAASRRSDRSLEARMESARRASDIHKKRTGRALRVTEQDVVNEEMYEEEDEDLQAQLRRLTSHVHTSGSPDFNRRLQALLATQVHLRMAMAGRVDHAQYTNGAGFAPQNYGPNMQPMQPMQQMQNMSNLSNMQSMQNMQNMQNMQQMQQMQNMQSMQSMQNIQSIQNMQTMNPQMMAPPTRQQAFRHSPYPMMPQGQMNPQLLHQRSGSLASMNGTFFQQSQSQSPATPSGINMFEDQRRMSLPATQRPTLSRNSSSIHTIKTESPQPLLHQDSSPVSHTSQEGNVTPGTFYSMPNTPIHFDQSRISSTISPLTTTLPAESQVILGPHMDPNDPATSMLMGGTHFYPQQQQFFNYGGNPSKPISQVQPSGMQQTLSPAQPTIDTKVEPSIEPSIESSIESNSASNLTVANQDDFPLYSPEEDQLFRGIFANTPSLSRDTSNQGSAGQATNDAEGWIDFLDFGPDPNFSTTSFSS